MAVACASIVLGESRESSQSSVTTCWINHQPLIQQLAGTHHLLTCSSNCMQFVDDDYGRAHPSNNMHSCTKPPISNHSFIHHDLDSPIICPSPLSASSSRTTSSRRARRASRSAAGANIVAVHSHRTWHGGTISRRVDRRGRLARQLQE